MARLPYPGLRPFTRDEADLFFGRDDEIDQIVDLLTRNRFLGVLGASGSGKSSLVRTGLFEALDGGTNIAGSKWQIVDTHPGGEPIARLAKALSEASARPGGGDPAEQIEEALRRGPRSIVEWCEAGNLAPDTNLLVLVDQFEELFSYSDAAARGDAQLLAGLLVESARSRQVPIYVALTMRSDYFGACGAYPELASTISESIFLTPRMLREACEEAIQGPAAVLGFEIKPDLVTELLNDLERFAAFDGNAGQASGQAARQADQLPLLQYALNRIWQRAAARSAEAVELTLDDYEEIGRLGGALDLQGETTIATLGASERDVERVFRSLVRGPSVALATRDPHRIREIAAISSLSEAAVTQIVAAFAADDCQFLRLQSPVTPHSYVDIPHESLIRQWRKLATWTERERDAGELWRRLAADASEWDEQGRDPDSLLAGLQLARRREWWASEKASQAWADRYPVERRTGGMVPLNLVGEYLEAGRARHEAGLAAARRRRHVIIGGAALLFAGTAAFAAYQRNTAAVLRESEESLLESRQGLLESRRGLQRSEAELKVALGKAEREASRAQLAEGAANRALVQARISAAEAVKQRDVAERASALAVELGEQARKNAESQIAEAKKAEDASRRVLAAASTILNQLEFQQDEVGESTLSRFQVANNMYDNLFSDSRPEADFDYDVEAMKRGYNLVLGNAALEMLGTHGVIANESEMKGFEFMSVVSERVRSPGAAPADVAQAIYWDGRVAELRDMFPEAATAYFRAFQTASDESALDMRTRAATALIRLRRMGVTAEGMDQAEEWCLSDDMRGWSDESLQCLAEVATLREAQGRTADLAQVRSDLIDGSALELACTREQGAHWQMSEFRLCADVSPFLSNIDENFIQLAKTHWDNNKNSEDAFVIYADILDAARREREAFEVRAELLTLESSTSFKLDILPRLLELDSRFLAIDWADAPARVQRQASQERRPSFVDAAVRDANPLTDGVRLSVMLLMTLQDLESRRAPEPLRPADIPYRSREQLMENVRTRLSQRLEMAREQVVSMAAAGRGPQASTLDAEDQAALRDEQIDQVEAFIYDLLSACYPNEECTTTVEQFFQLPMVKSLLEARRDAL